MSLDDEQMGAPLPEAHSAAVVLLAEQGAESMAMRPDLHLAFGLSCSSNVMFAAPGVVTSRGHWRLLRRRNTILGRWFHAYNASSLHRSRSN